jgi:uncharacterized protein (TIGR00369 family)
MTEKLTPMLHAAQNRCFGCGAANPIGLCLEFSLAPDGSVVCEKTVADLYEGPPGLVHGGIIATLLDEIMSKTVRALGIRAVTRTLEVQYLRPVHSQTPLRMEARLVRKEGRKHWTEARLLDADGKLRAQSTGLFIEVPGQV